MQGGQGGVPARLGGPGPARPFSRAFPRRGKSALRDPRGATAAYGGIDACDRALLQAKVERLLRREKQFSLRCWQPKSKGWRYEQRRKRLRRNRKARMRGPNLAPARPGPRLRFGAGFGIQPPLRSAGGGPRRGAAADRPLWRGRLLDRPAVLGPVQRDGRNLAMARRLSWTFFRRASLSRSRRANPDRLAR